MNLMRKSSLILPGRL